MVNTPTLEVIAAQRGKYRKEHGWYYFYKHGATSWDHYSRCVAVVFFDEDFPLLMDHGTPHDMQRAWYAMRSRYANAGMFEDAVTVLMFASNYFDVQDLNQLVNDPEYLPAFIEKYRLDGKRRTG